METGLDDWDEQVIANRRQPPAAGAVRWSGGFWGERFELLREAILPNMAAALERGDNAAVLSNFRIAARLEEGSHRGAYWSDGDVFKWFEALAHLYAATRDPGLEHELDELIELFGAAQAPDGYLSTQVQLIPGRRRFGERIYHELYNMGHFLTAACVHHAATGKPTMLDLARKTADYLEKVFAPRPPELAHFAWNPSNIMGLVELYRATGETRYLELAELFVSLRGSAPGGSDLNQDRIPLREETEAVGHAVTAAYLWCGAADVYAETGEEALGEALRRLWRDVMDHRLYVTGAIGALHRGVSRRHDMVWEAFGLSYELPNATAYNETCANLGLAMWAWRMLQLQPAVEYADVMETVLYNGGLAGMSLDGLRFRYTNPLRWHGREHDLLQHDSLERWTVASSYCCPPQIARNIAGLYRYAYSLDDDGVWCHLYGSNELATNLNDGAELRLRQETDYPWNGRIGITVEAAPERELTLRLRIPGWAEGATVQIAHEPAYGVTAGRYAVIQRVWEPGTSIVLELPLAIRRLVAHPRVEASLNQTAVARGPLVYCLESADLPHGVRLGDVHLPRRTELAPRHRPELLGGVTVLEGEAAVLARPTGSLYSELPPDEPRPMALTLVPYYAWNNRGVGEMTVWLPLL